jgi:hypothetical protein
MLNKLALAQQIGVLTAHAVATLVTDPNDVPLAIEYTFNGPLKSTTL